MKRFDCHRPEFTPYGLTCEVWEPHRTPRPDRHEEIEINFLDQGTLTYLLGGERVSLPSQRLSLFWAAIPHQIIDFERVTSYFVVTIPFDEFLHWGLPAGFRNRLIKGELLSCSEPQRSRLDAALLTSWHQDLSAESNQSREVVLLELQARLKRFAWAIEGSHEQNGTPPAAGNPDAVANLGKAEGMACFIARNYCSRIQIKDVAKSVGLHPDYASTLFRKSFGMTLNEHITTYRIAEVRRRLITTEDRVVDIALQSGFNSISRFNEAFKGSTGMTPREYRSRFQRAS